MISRGPAYLTHDNASKTLEMVSGNLRMNHWNGFKAAIFFGGVVLMIAILLLSAGVSQAGTPITLYRSFAGDIDFTSTGGSLRTQANGGNSCAVATSDSAALAGIPAGASIRAAYLYWAGSTLTAPDETVTFQGQSITADRTFTEIFPYGGTDYDFFSCVADVRSIVAASGNGVYSFAGLSVNTGAPHCNVSVVMAGWALIVVYEEPGEPLRVVNIFDGFQYYRGNQIVLTSTNFEIPSSPIDGKHGIISWEGDVENSAPLNGFSENLLFNGNPLIDAYNPLNNQYNSTINFLGASDSYGLDIDAYDISAYLTAGDTTAVSTYSSGGDLVLLNAAVLSVTNTPVADITIVKSHTGTFTVGQNDNYRIVVSNGGPNDAEGPITVTETLPAGLTYVSSSGTGWTADASTAPTIVWTHPGPLTPGQSLPELTLTVAVGSAAMPIATNTVSVASPTFDNIMANNSDQDPTTVLGPAAGNKPLYLYGDAGRELSRTLPVGTQTQVQINGNDASAAWTLTPATAGDLTLPAGLHPVRLWIQRNTRGTSRTVTVVLSSTGATTASLGSVAQTFTIAANTPTEIIFNINLASETTLASGSQLVLTIANSSGRRNRRIFVIPVSSGSYSRIDLNASSVIAIQSISAFDAAYPGGSEPANFAPGAIAYLRAVVSDPFGSFDINRTLVDLVNPNHVTVISEDAMPVVFDSNADFKIFEYAFAIPVDGDGTWTARTRAHEGTEAIVNDVARTTFVVGFPELDILFLKTATTLNDPFNGSTNPKAIPGAEVLYTLQATNQGPGVSDNDSVVLVDPIPANTELYVNDLTSSGSGPVRFADLPTASGLAYSFIGLGSSADDLDFSDDDGATYGYTPTPDVDGFDPAVTHIRVSPSGSLAGDSGSGSPGFEIQYKVRIR